MRKVVLRRSETLSPTVKGLLLSCLDGQPLAYQPGQWINLYVRLNGQPEKRAYSIASAPDRDHPEQFEVAVTRVDEGSVSLALHGMRNGESLELDGPFGFFTREGHERERALFVGTGTGVGPLRAMIQSELEAHTAQDGPALTLLFGCRSEADILYRSEFEALARAYPRFSFEPTLSRAEGDWTGKRGYVQTHLAEFVAKLERPHVYVCGLSNMVNAARHTLKSELGYDRRHIHTERYD